MKTTRMEAPTFSHLSIKPLLLIGAAVLLSSATVGGAAQTREVTLKVGDPAPKLQVSKWVQGEPVSNLERGQAYLVEFWATWCGPCRTTIPHLNELHNKYKDKGLTVIGQDVWERQIENVVPFVKKMGDKMTYRVALDDMEGSERGKMAENWMAAAGQNGIPAAFLVDKNGKIAWIGHPMTLKETVIDQVLAGSYDLTKAATDYAARQKAEAEMTELQRKVQASIKEENWEAAERTFDQMEKLLPETERTGVQFSRFRMNLARKDYPAAYKLARQLSDAEKDNAMLQNALAWTILSDRKIEKRDLDLAETMANRANDATKGKDAAILDTLARAKFMKGQKESAISLQKQAVDLADGQMKKQLAQTLASYEEGKLPEN